MEENLLWNTVGEDFNLARLLKARETHEGNGKAVQRNGHFTASLLRRMDLDYTLDGHQGCVNCIQWSNDGKILASGSDDTRVRIWDPFRNKCLHVVATKHVGNIFSVKFVGDGSLVATGAGDYRVMVQNMNDSEGSALIDCYCHGGRVKRLATAPDQPSLFWSAGEDGLIMQYDLRERHKCMKNSQVFVDLNSEFKCIAVNPTRPHLLAIGANDSYVRMYDRRLIKTTKMKEDRSEALDPNGVQYYAPGHLAKDNGYDQSFKLVATYIAFDSTGSELLVNLGGDHIYLFNIDNCRHIKEIRVPECLPNLQKYPTMKPCCQHPESFKKVRNRHEHNYKFRDNPCACDYMDRAHRMYKRKWIGDVYFAARDYLHVIENWPKIELAYTGLVNCFINLEWFEEAICWLEYYKVKFPNMSGSTVVAALEDKIECMQKAENVEKNEDLIEAAEITEEEKALRLNSMDYASRYIGHCNITTDIKEANFLGSDGNFICAGSDDGMIFIWDKKTTNLLTALVGDMSIVNCVQPHPSICCLASSGIDPAVKIWSPKNNEEDDYENKHIFKDVWYALMTNQDRLGRSPFEAMLNNLGYRVPNPSNPTEGARIASCRTS